MDPVALNDDLAHAADLFSSAEADGTIDYLAGFLAGVGRCAGDAQLTFCAERLRDAVNGGHPVARNLATLASMVQERLARRPPSERLAMVRLVPNFGPNSARSCKSVKEGGSLTPCCNA